MRNACMIFLFLLIGLGLSCMINPVISQTLKPTKGVCLGNSTVAKYKGGEAISSLLFTQEEIGLGYSCHSLAVPGHTINQQLDAWMNYADKGQADWIIIQIGLNDIQPGDPTDSALYRYQKLVDAVNATKKTGAKVIIATMIPCKERIKQMTKNREWRTSYKKWKNMNKAIMGMGKHAITQVDYRVNGHTSALNDGKGNLSAVFEIPVKDHIHENTAGRQIIASYWRIALSALNYL